MSTVQIISVKDLLAHNEAVCSWLTANGIDPRHVCRNRISIEQVGDLKVICYLEYQRSPEGAKLPDPEQPNQTWKLSRAQLMKVEPDWGHAAPLASAEQAGTCSP